MVGGVFQTHLVFSSADLSGNKCVQITAQGPWLVCKIFLMIFFIISAREKLTKLGIYLILLLKFESMYNTLLN